LTSDDFFMVWSDRGLRQFIVCQAKRYSCRPEIQEESIQEAWLCISCAPPDWNMGAYEELAYKAIRSHYWQYKKEQLLLEDSRSRRGCQKYSKPRPQGEEEEAGESNTDMVSWR